MLGEPEAIVYVMPTLAGSGDRCQGRVVAISPGAASAEFDIGFTQCWVSLTCDVDVLFASGPSGMGDPGANDYALWSKSYHSYWVPDDSKRFLKFRGLADAGTVRIHVSNR